MPSSEFATLWANGDVSSRATEASVPPDDPKAKEERLRWAKKTLAEIEQMTQKERRMFLLERGHGMFSFWPTLLLLLPLSNSSTERTEHPSSQGFEIPYPRSR